MLGKNNDFLQFYAPLKMNPQKIGGRVYLRGLFFHIFHKNAFLRLKMKFLGNFKVKIA